MEYNSKKIFFYNQKKKKLNGFFTIFIIGFIVFVLAYYFIFLRNLDIVFFQRLSFIFSHVKDHIAVSSDLLGALYVSLIGGLFFVFMPVEPLFIKFMSKNNVFLLFLVYIFGFFVSYSLNYFIGFKFSKLSKAIITPQKFYKMKGVINKYGGLAVYGFNALPLPSQPLSAILGVFRYNMTRFYFYFFLGQITKYGVIILFLWYF